MISLEKNPRLVALGLTAAFLGLIWLYYREFRVFSNTIHVKYLVFGAMLAVFAASAACLWRWRARFAPWDRHLPETFLLLIFPMLFAPLFASLLNRGLGRSGQQSFYFVSETPYIAQGYGFLKGEKVRVSGYDLVVKDHRGQRQRFRYPQRAFPLTQLGDLILLPVCWGCLGITVVQMPAYLPSESSPY
jgi:hypothetical protein